MVFRVVLLAYILTVAYLCFGNLSNIRHDIPSSLFGIPADKIVHFLMFLPFPILSWFSFDRQPVSMLHTLGKIICLAAVGCIFAGMTEIIQGMMPYRSEDVRDFYADMCGIGLASVIIIMIHLLTRRKNA